MRPLCEQRASDHADSGKNETQKTGNVDVDEEQHSGRERVFELIEDEERDRRSSSQGERGIRANNVRPLPVQSSRNTTESAGGIHRTGDRQVLKRRSGDFIPQPEHKKEDAQSDRDAPADGHRTFVAEGLFHHRSDDVACGH